MLALIAFGHRDRKIGATVFISQRTANKRVGNIPAKPADQPRAEAASQVIRQRLV